MTLTLFRGVASRRISFHRASFKRNGHDYRQTTGRFNALSSSSLAYPAIKIPHDYSRLPSMNIAPARSLHILLKAKKAKNSFSYPSRVHFHRNGKEQRLIKLFFLRLCRIKVTQRYIRYRVSRLFFFAQIFFNKT